ncbi:hypothetical protein D3C72_1345970 [compost metagenome]
MVSNAKEDLPLPLKPVNTVILLRGMVTLTSLRLCSLAPLTTIPSSSSNAIRPLLYGALFSGARRIQVELLEIKVFAAGLKKVLLQWRVFFEFEMQGRLCLLIWEEFF